MEPNIYYKKTVSKIYSGRLLYKHMKLTATRGYQNNSVSRKYLQQVLTIESTEDRNKYSIRIYMIR